MKPKEYAKKYNLAFQEKFDHSEFIGDLTVDFMTAIEFLQTGEFSLTKLDNCIAQIKDKFDSISYRSKAPLEVWDKLWKYFYATVVVKVKEEEFGDILRAQREEKARRKKERDEFWSYHNHNTYDDAFFNFNPFEGFRSHNAFDDLFGKLFMNARKPISSFEVLGLSVEATEEEVTQAYRRLAMQHHPDKGGKHEDFIKVTEAKNKCIIYLQQKGRS